MQFTSEQRRDDGVLEREFTLGEIPGVLWTPGSAPAPLILSGHNGGLHKREPRLVARARHYAAEYGYAVAAIDHPGHGDRPRSAVDEQARADLRRAVEAGEPVDEIVDAFILPLVEKAVPEWRTTLDALLSLPEIGGPVGYAGMTAIGIRLAVVEPRISAAGFFAGGFVPGTLREEARQVTIPLQFLLQWDDEGMER
ncbi:MAG: dienelactone hydrolase family protein, partial [Mycobacterium sp.]